MQYVTNEWFGCTDWDAVEAISPLLHKLIDRAPQHVPALAKALVRLHGIDLSAAPAAPNSEANFHARIQTNLNMTGLQYLYNGPCYNGFLNRRFDKLLKLARTAGDPDRGEIIRLLLASADPGTHVHASLTCARILLDPNKNDTEKMPLLWCTPNARQLLTEWSLAKTWQVYL